MNNTLLKELRSGSLAYILTVDDLNYYLQNDYLTFRQ